MVENYFEGKINWFGVNSNYEGGINLPLHVSVHSQGGPG